MKYCLSILPEIDRMLRGSQRVLIASDFDGTLCAIADTPSAVRVTPAMLEILRRAAACPRIELAVISGRALADVRRRVPLDIVFAGNHGLEIGGRGCDFEHAEAGRHRRHLEHACASLAQMMRPWPAAWIEDKGITATLHFRNVEQRQHHALLFAARQAIGPDGTHLALRTGRRALEIRPKIAWDKGSALEHIRERTGPFDACICLGDDRTDECMFRANANQLNVRVGLSAGSAATHYLSELNEVAILLSHIVDVCGPAARAPWVNALAASAGAAPMAAAAPAAGDES